MKYSPRWLKDAQALQCCLLGSCGPTTIDLRDASGSQYIENCSFNNASLATYCDHGYGTWESDYVSYQVYCASQPTASMCIFVDSYNNIIVYTSNWNSYLGTPSVTQAPSCTNGSIAKITVSSGTFQCCDFSASATVSVQINIPC